MKKSKKLFITILVCFCALFSGCSLEQTDYWYSFADRNFKPTPLNPASLTEEMKTEIKETYLAELVEKYSSEIYGQNHTWSQMTLDDVWVGDYYGVYNNCIAVAPYHKYMVPAEDVWVNGEYEIVVAGVAFLYTHLNFGYVAAYNQGKLYSLKEAYDENLLTKDDLKNIAYFHNYGMTFQKRTPKKPVDEKIIWNGDISQEFSDNEVIMVMDGNYTDWRFYAKDFVGVNVVAVEPLMARRLANPNGLNNFEGWRDIILIQIGNPGKQNVIDAIRELEKLDFVYAAEPNYYYSIGLD